jgi:hypothetical protein
LDAGGVRLLQMTIVGSAPGPLAQDDPLIAELQAQIAARSAVPPPPVLLQAADVVTFDLSGRLWLLPGADPKTVIAAATAAILQLFSPAGRALAQPVYAAELIQVLQATPGVAGAALDALYRSGQTRAAATVLEAAGASWNGQSQTVEPAELLVINTDGGIILVQGGCAP